MPSLKAASQMIVMLCVKGEEGVVGRGECVWRDGGERLVPSSWHLSSNLLKQVSCACVCILCRY